MPVVEGLVLQQVEHGHAGVVAQDVDAPEPFQCGCGQLVERGGVGNVHCERYSRTAGCSDACGDPLCLGPVEVGDHHG